MDTRHRAIISMAGALVAALIAGTWQLYTHFADTQTPPGSVNCGFTAGRDISNANGITVNCGPPINNDPRHKLSEMGIMWSEDGFIDAVLKKDSKALILFLDGGWKSDKLRFLAFANKYFDPVSASHWRQENFDADESCATPDVSGEGKGIYLFTHQPGSEISADYWLYHVPDFYEQIEKYKDPQRDSFIQRMCGVPSILAKFDGINKILINKKNVNSFEKKDIARWSSVKELLSRNHVD